ncbi:hypothetical protein H5410_033248 [Solanum commersonii]|uniref:Uncharacterized protein n=1 Tax=Solanum commersonii TaxID=4109 RepID=A0A9J5YSI5_SOLCO|nr:hypothetical protein H5410_033248 [Solanum commersonii]
MIIVYFNQKFDAIIRDITISANRSKYVYFTVPFTESSFSVVVPVKDDDRKNAWILVKPLKSNLWVTIGAFFVFIGKFIILNGGYLAQTQLLVAQLSDYLLPEFFQMHNPRCHFIIIFIQLISIISVYHYVIGIRGEDNNTSAVKVDVGIILDLETDVGKVMHISILLALEDYYPNASRGAIRIVPHIKDSKKEDFEATSAGQFHDLLLLNYVGVNS